MSRWKPQNWEEYFFFDLNSGEADCYIWEDDYVDNWNYDMGNCFKTEEEAEQALEKVKEALINFHKGRHPMPKKRVLTEHEKLVNSLLDYLVSRWDIKNETLEKCLELIKQDLQVEPKDNL